MPTIAAASYIPNLSEAQLSTLLSGSDATAGASLYKLAANAAAGDADSIELLLNLSARADAIGDEAESILFNLFSGRAEGRSGIADLVAADALRFYERNKDLRGKGKLSPETADKLTTPSALLYLAGAGAAQINAAATRSEIANVLGQDAILDTVFPLLPSGRRDDPWSHNRFLSSIEVDTAIAALANDKANQGDVSALGATEIGYLDINALLDELSKSDRPIFVPLNDDDHWMSLVVYKDETSTPRAVFFSSRPGYYEGRELASGQRVPGVKEPLLNALTALGINENAITVIEQDMQDNVPDGCGLFTVEAFWRVSEGVRMGMPPADALHDLVDDFVDIPAEEQARFNIDARRQIHGTLLASMQMHGQ